MKRITTLLGIALIVTTLLSGPVLASWYYVDHVESYNNCTNPQNIVGAPDSNYASIGIDRPQTLGNITLDFGINSGIPGGEKFTVFADSSIRENYTLTLIGSGYYWHNLDDTVDNILTAPSGILWRYVYIESEQGSSGDYAYGSDIDAVGYER